MADINETPLPLFTTYEDYLAGTPKRDIRAWCGRKAARANRARLLSGKPSEKITVDDVIESGPR